MEKELNEIQEWEVVLIVPCTTMAEWRKINKLADETDINSAGAGTGFGERDINWYKKHKWEAELLKKTLIKNFKGMKATVTIESLRE
jgi:hypothetical protein